MQKPFKSSLIILFTLLSTLFSCSSDADDVENTNNALVGVWQRIDSTTNFENKFVFNADNSGIKISSETNTDETAISNAISLEWISANNHLQLLINEVIDTPYYFNEEGQLVLSAISEIPFTKIEE
ncbi:hypothetical protein KO494_11715 [Lacinutrix sp. C3R15]|uniref:hypothetical protein n=1 Tax=Flavobacteriaceae TaxID=49546 RepID=UPI001C083CAC|nr:MULTISPECIES: hypothetical protein [Flavobacteriaceae]MBU2940204.1 hypothetical protein [Lacinutrix sp. C3R15]MDO6623521.1 hypothetical protein [Oceanihabitans sp. 1_MG-2023]